MNTSRKKVIGSLIGGIGLIETVGLMIRLLSNLAVIMLTPRSSGGGEYLIQAKVWMKERIWSAYYLL
jgi:hypothetical protein